MAQIPGVPTLEPVQKPYMSPQKASQGGETLSWFGGAVEGMALEGAAMQANIRNAQKQVDQITFQNQATALYDQMQVDLRKTTDSRAVPDLLDKYHNDLNGLVKQWDKSPAAPELGMHADALRPRMAVDAQLKQIDLMGKEWDAQTMEQKEKLMPELVTAIRNKDTNTEQAIRSVLKEHEDQALRTGIKSRDQISAEKREWDEAEKNELNEAVILSVDPMERQAGLKQLSKGGTGPLRLDGMSPAQIDRLRIHAESANNELENLADSHNLNISILKAHDYFKAPPFQGATGFVNRRKALRDPDTVANMGLIREDGQPDMVTASKLMTMVDNDSADYQRELEIPANEKINAISDAITNHKFGQAYAILHSGLTTIEAPERYKGEGAKLNNMIRVAATRTDAEISNSSNLARYTYWRNQIESGDMDRHDIQTGIVGDSGLREASGKELINYIDTVQNKTVSNAVRLADRNLQQNLAPSQSALIMAIMSGSVDVSSLAKLTPGQTQELDAYTTAEQELTQWVVGEQQKAAGGKRGDLTQKEIFDRAREIAVTHMPSMDRKLDAIHRGTLPRPTDEIKAAPGATIRVRDKVTGLTGSISPNEFNDTRYEKLR